MLRDVWTWSVQVQCIYEVLYHTVGGRALCRERVIPPTAVR